MASHNSRDKRSLKWTRDSPLTKKFVCLFYGILNNYPEHLHYFYGAQSRVAVSEFGPNSPPQTESADTKESIRELLRRFYKDVNVVVKTAIPQVSVEEGVLLVVSGTFTRTLATSNSKEEHSFTQSLMLAPQKHGYYVLTDTLHIMHGGNDGTSGVPFSWVEKDVTAIEHSPGSFYPKIETCPPKANLTKVINKLEEEEEEEGEVTPGKENIEGTSDDNPPTSPESTEKSNLKQAQENEKEKANEEEAKTTRNKVQTPTRKFQPNVQSRMPPPRRTRPLAPIGRGDHGKIPIVGAVGVPPGRPFKPHPPSNANEGRHMQGPPGRGVFIARLPFGIQAEEVVKAFSIFGPIVNGADGIQVRDGRNGCYAFVTFESTNAAQAAIQNGAVVQGKRVFVEARNMPQENVDSGFAAVHVPLPTNCVLPQLRPPHPLPTMVQMVRARPN